MSFIRCASNAQVD